MVYKHQEISIIFQKLRVLIYGINDKYNKFILELILNLNQFNY